MTINVDEEIDKLKAEIARLGKVQSDGSISNLEARVMTGGINWDFAGRMCKKCRDTLCAKPFGLEHFAAEFRNNGHMQRDFSKCVPHLLFDDSWDVFAHFSLGTLKVKFGTLFKDERCANLFEALVGTLRAAKKRKLLKFDGELLLQGVHDNVDVILFHSVGDSNVSKDVPSKLPASKHAGKN